MRFIATVALILGLASGAFAQSDEFQTQNSVVLGGPKNIDLAAGAVAIQSGDYDTGIERTLKGLEDETLRPHERSAGLSNLCGAYAAKQLPESAIRYCTESLAYDDHNWRAYNNRSYAYWIMGRYPEAQADLEAATALNPNARQPGQIRGMINEKRLRPNIVMEDLQ